MNNRLFFRYKKHIVLRVVWLLRNNDKYYPTVCVRKWSLDEYPDFLDRCKSVMENSQWEPIRTLGEK